MKKLIIAAGAVTMALLLSLSAHSQDIAELEWLSSIDNRSNVAYAEAAKLFVIQLGKTSSTFEADQIILSAAGVALEGYKHDTPLTRGMLSKMTVKYLHLGGSLMYLITGWERYAYKACVANGIFTEEGSPNDLMSGPEMIEVFVKISGMVEGRI